VTTAPAEAAAPGGDPWERGLEELYRDLAPGFFRWARHRGLSEHDAYDAVQNTMVKLHRYWDRVERTEPGKRPAYAFKVLRSAVHDVERKRRNDLALDAELRRRPPPAIVHDEHIEPDPVGAAALRLLDSLTPGQRQVMELAGDGLKPREIATELEMTPSTVRTHLCAARKFLKSRLQAWKDSSRGQ
jgi:RNA polymerase sigma factor (sigma-70 family)